MTLLFQAYILYMRFIDIAVYIRKSPFYERDRKYYDSMLNMKDTSMAMQRAEALEIELSDLYRKNELKMKKAKEMEIQQKISERNDKIKVNFFLMRFGVIICTEKSITFYQIQRLTHLDLLKLTATFKTNLH